MKTAWMTVFLTLAVGHATGGELANGWQALAGYRAGQALGVFDPQQNATDPGLAREARFGHAVALLDHQPVSGAELAEAQRVFTAMAESGTDDFAQGARFFLGRIAQHHLAEPDAVEASRQFRRLIKEHVNSVWAQSALSRLALLEIYALSPDSAPAGRIAAAENLVASARTPAAKCEVHYVIATAILFYRLPGAGALPHLVAAERLNRLGWSERTEVLVQIAELSRLSGHQEQAAEYYQKFLTENPRDQRHYIIQQRLEQLQAAGVALSANAAKL
ncbi:MAG: hypothetical protein K9N01_10145 [Cephaloticoccus sp.]|nr:hypothetical protein [Cephaloticoccus sp.]